MFSRRVLRRSAGGDVWLIESSPTQANLISPPITYGTTSLPAGVQVQTPPAPLVRGTSGGHSLYERTVKGGEVIGFLQHRPPIDERALGVARCQQHWQCWV